MANKDRVIIVGGGLSGLTLAYLLQKHGRSTVMLEADSRLGGRIKTVQGNLGTPLEMGATWFADKHKSLSALVDALGLRKFPQFTHGISLFHTHPSEAPQQFTVPPNEAPSYRVVGGTQLLTDMLAQNLVKTEIHLQAPVVAINGTEAGVQVQLQDGTILAGAKAAVCIPPQLAVSQIQFYPNLPDAVCSLFASVQTWMAGAIKFTVEYSQPFWRNKGLSGMVYSHAGIIAEMYDHTNFEGDRFGFTGFLHGHAAQQDTAQRKEKVLQQLARLMGVEALAAAGYFDQVWNGEWIQAGNPIIQQPHQNNGHPRLQQAYIDGKLLFCATETGGAFPGYMEGAVEAAIRGANQLLQ